MIGVDTNVLIRYYVADDIEQHNKAKAFIDANNIFISNIVLVESYWVLIKLYKVDKKSIEAIFDHVRRLSNVSFENETVLARSIIRWKKNNCDFGDAMIASTHEEHGCDTVTFDINASKRLGKQLLS